MTMMGLNYLIHEETKRSNLVREGETYRHNVVSETLDALELGETQRANLVREDLGYGNLDELTRSNRVREGQAAQAIAETYRSNRASEAIRWADVAEKVRSNTVHEAISWSSLAETKTHNRQTEALARVDLMSLSNYRQASVTKDYWSQSLNAVSKGDPTLGAIIGADSLNTLSGMSEKDKNMVTRSIGMKAGVNFTLDSLSNFITVFKKK